MRMSDVPVGPGSWQASDGKWYPAEQAPGATPPPPGYGSTPPAPGLGGPPPGMAYGAPGPLASWGQRVVAWLLDGLILTVGWVVVFIAGAVLGAISDVLGSLVGLVGFLALFGASFYFFYMQGAVGATPAKKLMGLKVVGIRTGQPIGGGLGIVRYLAHVVDGLVCYLGFLLPLVDKQRQTLADKIMSTVVLAEQPKEEFGPDLFKI
jgi:uncharacterized RDD family membrane protein YckC